jgi:hypothetical protein
MRKNYGVIARETEEEIERVVCLLLGLPDED